MTIDDRIVAFIVAYIDENGYPPTFREIGAAVRIRSTSMIKAHMDALEEAGRIRRRRGLARTVQVMEQVG